MEEIKQPLWYVIHTYSGYEVMVKDNIAKMVENNNLGDFITNIEVPMEDDIVERNGKKKVIQRKKFPGYVFLKMVYTNHIWYLVANTRGVTGFVGPQGHPQPLTIEEIRRMGLEAIVVEDLDIKVGDNIKVVSGALSEFVGVVEEVNQERQKVKVTVSMFGRQTPVELDFAQVEKVN